jgi:hypothetical protein
MAAYAAIIQAAAKIAYRPQEIHFPHPRILVVPLNVMLASDPPSAWNLRAIASELLSIETIHSARV